MSIRLRLVARDFEALEMEEEDAARVILTALFNTDDAVDALISRWLALPADAGGVGWAAIEEPDRVRLRSALRDAGVWLARAHQ